MNRDEQRDSLWDYLESELIATEEELQLITKINGFKLETMEAVLYARTGYRSLDQVTDMEGDSE